MTIIGDDNDLEPQTAAAAPTHHAPEVEALLAEVIAQVDAARPMPLSTSSMINREELLELLQRTVAALPEDHAPVLHIRFGIESDMMIKSRDEVFDAIPGTKSVWDMPRSTHYFSTFSMRGVLAGNTAVARSVSGYLKQFAHASRREAPSIARP